MTDIQQLEAEANAALAGAPPDPTAPPPAPGESEGPVAAPVDPAAQWAMYTDAASRLMTGMLLPQWGITAEERTELAESLAQILALHFPDGLDGKYAGYFRLLACSSIIVATRYAAGGGRLPPLGPKRLEAPKQQPERRPQADPHAPVN